MTNNIQDQENNAVVGLESAYIRPREEILLKLTLKNKVNTKKQNENRIIKDTIIVLN